MSAEMTASLADVNLDHTDSAARDSWLWTTMLTHGSSSSLADRYAYELRRACSSSEGLVRINFSYPSQND